jgi:hypothetical protein
MIGWGRLNSHVISLVSGLHLHNELHHLALLAYESDELVEQYFLSLYA